MEKNKPAHEVKLGRVRVTIWANETTRGTRHGVTVGRLYKAKDGWKTSASLDREDLLLTAKALDEAHTWILAKEAIQGLIELRSIDEADSAEEVA